MSEVKISELSRDAIRSYADQRSDWLMDEILDKRAEFISCLRQIYKDDKMCVKMADDAIDWAWYSGSPYYPQAVERLRKAPQDIGHFKRSYLGILPPSALQARSLRASDQMRRLVDLGHCLNDYRAVADRADKIGHLPQAEREPELERLRVGLEAADVAVRSRNIEDRDSRDRLRKDPVMADCQDPDIQEWLRSEPDR